MNSETVNSEMHQLIENCKLSTYRPARRSNENPVSAEIKPIFPPAPGKCTNEGNETF